MQAYYHWTTQERAERILKEGLKPGKDVGLGSTHNGRLCDNTYAYLAKNLDVLLTGNFRGILEEPGTTVLELSIEEKHPLERDMDVHLLITTTGMLAGMNLYKILGDLAITDILDFYELLPPEAKLLHKEAQRNNTHNNKETQTCLFMLAALDETFVTTLLKRATQEAWDKIFGFYRTQQFIPNQAPHTIRPINIHTFAQQRSRERSQKLWSSIENAIEALSDD
ncbi:MAG: hypothetical protein Q7R96_05460 [Nanoarchaeota archaeon]|nr:hypothetical protein [Nanoarchaeota archaeon]